MCRPSAIPSTYALVAASVAWSGAPRLTILYVPASRFAPRSTFVPRTLLVSVCWSDRVATVESMSTFTLLLLTVDVIPVPPSNVSVSAPRVTLSVPVSPAIPRVVEIEFVVTFVTLPLPSTVIAGIAVLVPYVPTAEFTVSRVTLIVVSPRLVITALPSTSPAIVIVGSPTLKFSFPLVSSYSTEIPLSVLEATIPPIVSCRNSVDASVRIAEPLIVPVVPSTTKPDLILKSLVTVAMGLSP